MQGTNKHQKTFTKKKMYFKTWQLNAMHDCGLDPGIQKKKKKRLL